jgi:hypothetical protein
MYTENTRSCKTPKLASATVEQINEYTIKVLKGLISCILPPCPGCGLESDWYKRHEARRRKFHVVIEQIVHVVSGLLIRWKCPVCGKTFTQYPDFALPHKRYTLPTIMDLSSKYTENEAATYRKIVRSAQPGYHDSERQLEHSTVHRWLTSLSRLKMTLSRAADLILQAAPCSNACRDAAGLSVPPAKHRSAGRKSMLERCRRLFFFVDAYRATFDLSIFPELATACLYG